jgi:hypothetical protein
MEDKEQKLINNEVDTKLEVPENPEQNYNNQNIGQNAASPNTHNSESLSVEQLIAKEKIKQTPGEIIGYLITILLYYLVTKESNFTDTKCDILRNYAIYAMYTFIGFIVLSVYTLIHLCIRPAYCLVLLDRGLKFLASFVILVLFQIGVVQSSNCGILGVLVISYLTIFYLILSCGACAACFIMGRINK